MITIRLFMKVSKEPLKRVTVELQPDAGSEPFPTVMTDRDGIACFDLASCSGRVLVSGVERFHGRLHGNIEIGLWSLTQAVSDSTGSPGDFPDGSNAYPGMTTRQLTVDGRQITTDSEGYLINPAEWSEAFAHAQAEAEGLELTAEHWEVIRYLREYYVTRGTQATVRDMIKHFRAIWDHERGSAKYLHRLFLRGGPQKQGNRLAGLLRTKGEH